VEATVKGEDDDLKKVGAMFGTVAVVGIILNLVFWLGLAAGILWLLKHFGVIR
jgi:hypothetical protein